MENKLFASEEQQEVLTSKGIIVQPDLISILNCLPNAIYKDKEEWYSPTLIIERNKGEWAVHYGLGGQAKWTQSIELIDAAIDMLIWLKENNFLH